jgi:hypothetical protein
MSIIRLQSLYTISVGTDTSMDGVLIALYTAVEVNVAIICASLPANKALIQRIFPYFLGSTGRGGHTTNYAGHNGYANMDGSTIAAGTNSHKMRSLAPKSRNWDRDEDYKGDDVVVDVRTDIEVSSLDGSQTNLAPVANGGTFLADCWSNEQRVKQAKGRQPV